MNPFTDYVESGWKLGLNPHPLFDVDHYLNNNIDVLASGDEPFKHYSTVGHTEDHMNRDPNGIFDNSYYRANNPDVVDDGMVTLYHYSVFGDTENHMNRDPNRFFDNSYYNLNNPDVVADPMTASEHWMNFGYIESRPENPNFNPNRNTHPFLDSSDYYIYNDDVRIASYTLPSANPNQHLREFGLIEDRVTHEIARSNNVAEVTKRVTADDESFPVVKQVLKEVNVEATPTEDGQIALTNIFIDEDGSFNILEPVEDAADAVIVGGLTLTIFAGLAIKSGIENYDWQLGLESGFGGFVNNPFFIAPFGVPTGTPAFPEFTESPRIVEIFRPEEIVGSEDIFTLPQESLNIPNTTASPARDELLEGLLNGGIFAGGEEIPQGTYVLISTRDGDLYAYNPNSLSNLKDNSWDSILQENLNAQLDRFDDEILPVRSTLDPRFDDQGNKIPPRTHGIFKVGGNNEGTKFVSGKSNISVKVRTQIVIPQESIFEPYVDDLPTLTSRMIKNDINASLSHVEGHAASFLRLNNLEFGRITINNQDGPCPRCVNGLPRILNDGQILEVIYIDSLGRAITDTFVGGQKFLENRDRSITEF